jgi:glycosyltransferase involved in cell wall biosynthesis
MKILQIAPIYVPLRSDLKYGGIERVVLALGRVFNEQGHEVINAAPADSNPPGKLLPTLPQSEWTKPKISWDPNAYEIHVGAILDFLAEESVDVIHDHTGNFVLSETYAQRRRENPSLEKIPTVVTPHELKRFKRSPLPDQRNIFFTALSEYQRSVFSEFVPVRTVIHNGVFLEDHTFRADDEGYLFSLGSIERDKGQDLAVRVALETELPLKIGGNIAEQAFYDLDVKLAGKGRVEYLGELNDKQKAEFFAGARAFLAPIRLGDCFSLTRIESLAAGTPVITLDTGSAREAITHGRTGYLVNYDLDGEDRVVADMANYVGKLNSIDPKVCRAEAKKRFDWWVISQQYLNFYDQVISQK